MESAPAVFAGSALALFGAGLLLWTVTRTRSGRSVAELPVGQAGSGALSPRAAAVLAGLSGVISLMAAGLLLLKN